MNKKEVKIKVNLHMSIFFCTFAAKLHKMRINY